MYTKQEIIIQSHREGKSQRTIARELKISRKTVRKYLFDYESHLRGSPNEKASLSRVFIQGTGISKWFPGEATTHA